MKREDKRVFPTAVPMSQRLQECCCIKIFILCTEATLSISVTCFFNIHFW